MNLSESCLGWTGENYRAYKHLGMVETEATTPNFEEDPITESLAVLVLRESVLKML